MELTNVLNKQIANWSVLYIKLHNYHWYVTGDQFFTLHEKFEQLYTEAAGYIDELAERLLIIGGKPTATMKEYLEQSSVKEAQGSETASDMVRSIVGDLKQISSELKEGIEAAESAEDHPTADMFIGIRTNLQKHVWMLDAFLG